MNPSPPLAEPAQAAKPLRPIGSLAILDISYDLAANGAHYHLVEHKEPDAYCRPVARRVELADWLTPDRAQNMLDLLGYSYARVAELEAELGKAHTALQREAEPERRPAARERGTETMAGVAGVLEEGPKG
jgi:hypothetical protein